MPVTETIAKEQKPQKDLTSRQQIYFGRLRFLHDECLRKPEAINAMLQNVSNTLKCDDIRSSCGISFILRMCVEYLSYDDRVPDVYSISKFLMYSYSS